MRVLVACEESQAVTVEMRRLGHEAYSCDIQECSGGHPEWHIQDDVLKILGGGWDLIIAHPPCTYLSNLGIKHLFLGTERIKRENDVFRLMNEERVKSGILARDFFLAMLMTTSLLIVPYKPTHVTLSPTTIITMCCAKLNFPKWELSN